MIEDHQGWGPIAQLIITAIATWYIRRGGKKDKEEVKRATVAVANEQSCELGERMVAVENGLLDVRTDVGVLKRAMVREPQPGHVSPLTKENKNG